jgi:hypothetical protein
MADRHYEREARGELRHSQQWGGGAPTVYAGRNVNEIASNLRQWEGVAANRSTSMTDRAPPDQAVSASMESQGFYPPPAPTGPNVSRSPAKDGSNWTSLSNASNAPAPSHEMFPREGNSRLTSGRQTLSPAVHDGAHDWNPGQQAASNEFDVLNPAQSILTDPLFDDPQPVRSPTRGLTAVVNNPAFDPQFNFDQNRYQASALSGPGSSKGREAPLYIPEEEGDEDDLL